MGSARVYSQMIAIADATLAQNERLRAYAAVLHADSRAVLIEYRSHRMLLLRGGSDGPATNAAAAIRAKVFSGALPMLTDPPPRYWVGKGTGRACDGCDKVIAADEIEYELDGSDARTLRLHADCLGVWHATHAEQLTEPAQALAGIRIVVVDDHEDSRDLLRQAFAFVGADVTMAVTAEEAMQSIANADVVVTDFALKGKDGAWLLEQINASVRPIPVVLLSGFVETPADARFALRLLKPVDPIELAQKIRAMLDGVGHDSA